MSIDMTIEKHADINIDMTTSNKNIDLDTNPPVNVQISGDYDTLKNKPQINYVELIGNKTLDDLNIANKNQVQNELSNKLDVSDLEELSNNEILAIWNAL